MRSMLAAALVASSAPAFAQVTIQMGGYPGGVMEIQGGAATVAYRPSEMGGSGIQVFAPAGARIRILRGAQPLAEGVSSLWVPAVPGLEYGVTLHNPDGSAWNQPVVAQPGMTAVVNVSGAVAMAAPSPTYVAPAPAPSYVAPAYQPAPSPPAAYAPPPQPVAAGPGPMDPGAFGSLVSAINAEAFPSNKLQVLRTAAQGAFFTCAQVGRLIDLFAFPDDKVKVVAITHRSLVDPQDSFTLYGHFAFPDDKAKVRRILAQ